MKYLRYVIRHFWLILGLFLCCLYALGVVSLSGEMAPVQEGNGQDFWEAACRVSLEGTSDSELLTDAYWVDHEWAAYHGQHYHGSVIYRVRAEEVSRLLPAVADQMSKTERADAAPYYQEGYRDWVSNKDPQDCPGLITCIKEAKREHYLQNDPKLYVLIAFDEGEFNERWMRSNWYWATLIFDWAFLSGFTFFLLWPAIRNASSLRWGVHFALAPIFFLAPVYLGYAKYTFTSAGPSGGVLYPHLVIFLRHGRVTDFDDWVLKHLPQMLEPISTPLGPWLALTGLGMPGPTDMIVKGLILGSLVFVCVLTIRLMVSKLCRNDNSVTD